MHPKALLDACADLVAQVLRFEHPADAVVSRYFREHRELGPRERATLAETAYAVLRRKLLFEHLAPSGSGPRERRLATLGERHRTNLPEWLAEPLKAQLGADFLPLARALEQPAPLDLRVNALNDKREDVRAELQ